VSTVEFDSRLAESNWGQPDYYRPILPLGLPAIAAPDQHDAWLQPVEQRVTALMADLVQRPAERVLLFGHWGIFGALFRVFVGLAADDDLMWATMDNTGISLLEQGDDQRRYLRFWNVRPHWSADF
jgi:broad specificity phosphatase PhoE